MTVTVTTSGFKEMEQALLGMKSATAKATVRRAMAKALEPVAAAARAGAPRSDDGNHMADGIAVSKKLVKNQAKEARSQESATVTEMFVGPRSSQAHLVEFGTGPRFHASGKFVGVMPAQPFMRPAWDANKGKVMDILSEELAKEIAKTVARAAKRAAKGR